MDRPEAKTDATRNVPRLRLPDRAQPDPDPQVLDRLIAADHPARLVWEMVQSLDFAALYDRIKAVEGHPGRTPIDPRLLTALWLYATSEGIARARELERRCYDCDPFKWLRGGVDLNYHTLSDFRTRHGAWLEQQVVTVVAAMRAEGLLELNQVGQDGLRVRASAGSGSFQKEGKLDEHLAEAQRQWDRLQAEFQEGPAGSARQQAARRRRARERLERLRRAQEEVAKVQAAREARKQGDGAAARASTTDPEARRMKMPDGGFRPAYNVQFATTLDTLVIVGVDVTNAGGDGGQMDPLLGRIETQQRALPQEYYADGGFATQADIQDVSRRGVVVYTPVKEAGRRQQQGQDPYAPRRGDSPEVAAWRQRMGTPEAQAKYRQRCRCEWSNAQARNRGLYRFVVRGLDKVKAVACWYALAQNLLRWVALRAGRGLAAG